MSDSLNATVIVSVLVLTISANADVVELLDDELEPRLPLVALAPLLDDPDELDPEPLVVELPVLLAVTVSPRERLSSETTVPTVGEYSLVSASAVLALSTDSSALYTDACADAMLDADEVVLVAPVDDDPPLPALEPVALGAAVAVVGAVEVVRGVVVVGVVVVGVVVAGVVVVGVVVVGVMVVGVVVVGVVVVGVVVLGVVVVGVVEVGVVKVVMVVLVLRLVFTGVTSETNSVLSELVATLVVDELEDELSSALLS
jgi:hypothetical protein